MNIKLTLQRASPKELQKVFLILALVGLLLPINISSFLLIVFVLFSILISFLDKKSKPVFDKSSIVFSGFFSLYIFSVFYSDSEVAIKALERNISWLILPLIFSFTTSFSSKDKFKILIPFAVSTHIMALFYLLMASVNYFNSGNIGSFYYTSLTEALNFHPVYFALYVLFSFCILAESFYNKRIKLPFYGLLLFFIFDVVFLLLLASKNILLVFGLIVLFFVIKNVKKQKWLLVFLLLPIILFFGSSVTKDRFQDSLFSKWDLLSQDKFEYNDKFTGVTLRLITWKLVLKEMNSNDYFIGVGKGDSQKLIDNTYVKHNMDSAGYLGYNMHNQFLEYFVCFGILGLLYFIIILVLCFKRAITRKDYLYLIFLLSFISLSLTESNLQVHRGLLYFMLLNSLFFSLNLKK